MKFDFFEEFPKPENLGLAAQIPFPSTVYLAHHSLSAYLALAAQFQQQYPHLQTAYWPILKKSYWISPFSYSHELEALKKELQHFSADTPLQLLFDLELPLLNTRLFVRNLRAFNRNKRIIRDLFALAHESDLRIHTAEYPLGGRLFQKNLERLGVSYSIQQYPHKKIMMYYTSIIPQRALPFVNRALNTQIQHNGAEHVQVGLGTIARGIFGNEPILSPAQLDRDLEYLQSIGIQHVVLFRLGGLNQAYLDVLQRYTTT